MSEHDDEYEEEFEEDDSAEDAAVGGSESQPGVQRTLALGYLACVPLLAAYEWSLATSVEPTRSTAEMCLFRFLLPLGEDAHMARRCILAGLLLVCIHQVAGHSRGLGMRLLKMVGEGGIWALLLAPTLILCTHLLGGVEPPAAFSTGPGAPPGLSRAAFILGAAAHEELFFRVILYSGLYLMARVLMSFFGAGLTSARLVGEAAGLVGSAGIFAALHLEAFTAWLGRGGEAFEPFVFLWRLLAGMALAGLLRWRGPGVAAWTHALFNLGLLLGAGPERVF
ncbi:MAG: hypothetical protein QGI93_14635 [Planctomycetota bacterium]|nr:hypothetical protein [Planctomycetota bacterium]